MADAKTTALTAATSWASGDLLYMVSDPGGTPVSRKITLDNVFGKVASTLPIGWTDALLYRRAANVIAMRNSTNAQTLEVYGTWTSDSVFERMFMRYSVANTRYEIGTEHTGASARSLYVTSASNLSIDASAGNLTLTQGSVNILSGSGSKLILMPNTATAAGGVRAFQCGTTTDLGLFFGSGAPTVSAAKGSLYLRSDGSGTSDRLYVNTDGATTWTAVTTAA